MYVEEGEDDIKYQFLRSYFDRVYKLTELQNSGLGILERRLNLYNQRMSKRIQMKLDNNGIHPHRQHPGSKSNSKTSNMKVTYNSFSKSYRDKSRPSFQKSRENIISMNQDKDKR